MPHEPVTEIDLNAYVDGQLDPARRIEVEDFLSRHPEEAMRVMADLRQRDALRWALGVPRQAPAGGEGDLAAVHTRRLARRLERGLARRGLSDRLRQAAAAVLLVAVGWAGHVGYAARYPDMRHVVAATAPSFVEDAVQAHRTAKVRAAMASQPRVPHLDADELLRATGVRVPALPASWAVRDVQVFPGRTGPSVEMEVEAAGLGRLWVFAAREPSHAADAAPVVSRFQDAPIAYWQQGQWAYAITGDLPDAELSRAAGQITVAMLATP